MKIAGFRWLRTPAGVGLVMILSVLAVAHCQQARVPAGSDSGVAQAAPSLSPSAGDARAADAPAGAPSRTPLSNRDELDLVPGDAPVRPSPASDKLSGRNQVRYPRPEEVPLAPMGETIGYSPVTASPGYHPVKDPEADAVRTGRRVAAKVSYPFSGGADSPEALAQLILDGLAANDFNALQRLRVTPDEFSEIMWKEFPESRPLCNSNAETAYFFLDRTSHSGITLGLTTWGSQKLTLLGLTYAVGRAPYTNFTLYRGVEIHVKKEDGSEGVIRVARTFAERDGSWKVYAFKDKE